MNPIAISDDALNTVGYYSRAEFDHDVPEGAPPSQFYWDALLRSHLFGPRTHPLYSLRSSIGERSSPVPPMRRVLNRSAPRFPQKPQHSRVSEKSRRIRQRLLRGLVAAVPEQEMLLLADDIEENTAPRGTGADGISHAEVSRDGQLYHSGAFSPPIAAVLDSGHLTDPILLCDTEAVLPRGNSVLHSSGLSAAVLVQPLMDEVWIEQWRYDAAFNPSEYRSSSKVDYRACSSFHNGDAQNWDENETTEAICCGSVVGSQCREWLRQYAIRKAVGVTTQEALIDLKVDPRYRRPGEFVKYRHKKGLDRK